MQIILFLLGCAVAGVLIPLLFGFVIWGLPTLIDEMKDKLARR